MNAAQTFRRDYREAMAKRRQFGMDQGDDVTAHEQPEDLDDALADDDLLRPDDRSADDDEDDDDTEGAACLKGRCSSCGEHATVLPPKGIKLVSADSAEAESENVLHGKGLKWQCTQCGASNTTRLTRHRLVKADEAAAFFASRYRPAFHDEPDQPGDNEAAKLFRESYARHEDRDDWNRARSMYPR